LAKYINFRKGNGYISKFKIDKYKHLIKKHQGIFGFDNTNNPIDLTPLYQKRRVKKAKLSKCNKKNKMIAPCIYKTQPNIQKVLITD
jgi:hypothetical protein